MLEGPVINILNKDVSPERIIHSNKPWESPGPLQNVEDAPKSGDRVVGMKAHDDVSIRQPSQPSYQRKQDPLRVLPPELWLQCLLDVVNDDSVNTLPLLLVSRTWCNTLISAAPLWTNICIRDSPEHIDCMPASLKFSQGLPLCVTVEIPVAESITDLPYSIWEESSRIRELVFKRSPAKIRNSSSLDVHAMDQFYDAAYEILTSRPTKNFAILEWITLNHAFDYYSLSMTDRPFPPTPRLRGIKFWCITEVALPCLIRPESLTYLSSSSPMRDLFPSLSHLKQLRRLILTQAGEGDDDPTPVPSVNAQNLPELTALEFYQNSPQAILPFLNVPNSNLVELQMKLTWPELGRLAPCLANLTRLRHLHFILKPPRQELQGLELLFPPLHHVHKFQLEQQAPSKPPQPAVVSPSIESSTGPLSPGKVVVPSLITGEHMRSLLDACRISMTGISSFLLVLQDKVPTRSLLALIGAMKFLRKLEFKGELTKEEPDQIVIPSLQEIVLSNEALLVYIAVPNVLEVYIAAAVDEERSAIQALDAPLLRSLSIHSSLASAIRTKKYAALTNLTWIDPAGGCASISKSFDSLTRILFDYSSPRKECNDFCELILRYPASCKSLHTLEMRAYPELDILLHMLQRRNFLSAADVAMITTIKIPGYPAPSLLVPLTELLEGRTPKYMPSIDELCLAAVDGPYFDVNVLGCEDCIDCRMTCQAPLDRHNEKKYRELEDNPLKEPDTESVNQREVPSLRGSNPPLSKELQTWFDGWSVRRTKWYTKWNRWDKHSRRKGACERHDYGDLVSITGDLLHGIPYQSVVISVLSGPKPAISFPTKPLAVKKSAPDRDIHYAIPPPLPTPDYDGPLLTPDCGGPLLTSDCDGSLLTPDDDGWTEMPVANSKDVTDSVGDFAV